MKKEEIKKRIEAAEAELKQCKELLNQSPDEWKDEDKYWFINSWGEISGGDFTDHRADHWRIKTNNIFKDHQTPEAILKIMDRIAELNGDWFADWSDCDLWKYTFGVDHVRKKITVTALNTIRYTKDCIIMKSEEIAKQIRSEFSFEHIEAFVKW